MLQFGPFHTNEKILPNEDITKIRGTETRGMPPQKINTRITPYSLVHKRKS